ncbi:MAG: hypothetical protein ACJAS3_001296 [Roseivirga sp.]|jgi:hypothetical protein
MSAGTKAVQFSLMHYNEKYPFFVFARGTAQRSVNYKFSVAANWVNMRKK